MKLMFREVELRQTPSGIMQKQFSTFAFSSSSSTNFIPFFAFYNFFNFIIICEIR